MIKRLFLLSVAIFVSSFALAQGEARVSAQLDTRQITIGDQARLFLIAEFNPATGRLQWPTFIDTFNKLEIVEKGKIDTIVANGKTTYRQRLLITGFDSGLFKIPAFQFAITPNSGTPYVAQTDSFMLMVQTVAVDTTKDFKPIKNIIYVKPSWLDYLWLIIGGLVLVIVAVFMTIYFLKNRKEKPAPVKKAIPLQDQMLAKLDELDKKQLWQQRKVKEYYIELTEIVRGYIEERFQTPALELTTDELLYKARYHRELQPYLTLLSVILTTADLAKFAKGEPLPQEHYDALENARKFIDTTRPLPVTSTPTTETKI